MTFAYPLLAGREDFHFQASSDVRVLIEPTQDIQVLVFVSFPDPENIFKMRCELRDAGITESVIYPDLDGLGREIKQTWEDRK